MLLVMGIEDLMTRILILVVLVTLPSAVVILLCAGLCTTDILVFELSSVVTILPSGRSLAMTLDLNLSLLCISSIVTLRVVTGFEMRTPLLGWIRRGFSLKLGWINLTFVAPTHILLLSFELIIPALLAMTDILVACVVVFTALVTILSLLNGTFLLRTSFIESVKGAVLSIVRLPIALPTVRLLIPLLGKKCGCIMHELASNVSPTLVTLSIVELLSRRRILVNLALSNDGMNSVETSLVDNCFFLLRFTMTEARLCRGSG